MFPKPVIAPEQLHHFMPFREHAPERIVPGTRSVSAQLLIYKHFTTPFTTEYPYVIPQLDTTNKALHRMTRTKSACLNFIRYNVVNFCPRQTYHVPAHFRQGGGVASSVTRSKTFETLPMTTSKITMSLPGIETGSRPWQGRILPLDHKHVLMYKGCDDSQLSCRLLHFESPIL